MATPARFPFLRTLLHAGICLLLLPGCRDVAEGPPGPPDPLSEEEAARAIELGAGAADALASGLVGRLTTAIQVEGLAGAVDFCSIEALPLTRRIQAEHDERLALKRTTLRWRNPDNAPDDREERVLRYLEALEASDPESVPAELTARGPDGTLRYYRVLRTAPMCLECHGDLEALDPGVRSTLASRYPDDRATGYGAGDLRGVIRVEIPPAGVPEVAP